LIFNTLPGFIITSLLPVYPFLQPQFRSRPNTVTSNDNSNADYNSQSTLLPGTRVTCTFPKTSSSPSNTVEEVYLEQIIGLEDVRSSLQALLTAPSATRWSLGWGGGHSNSNSELPLETQLDLGSHVVVLRVPPREDTPKGSNSMNFVIDNFSSLHVGAQVTAHGCPFGALVSLKFHNFMISGALSALLERQQQKRSPLSPASSVVALSDLKILPGMEGGVVCLNNNNNNGNTMIGIVGPPLRAPEAHAELSVVLSATIVLNAAVRNLLVKQKISLKSCLNPRIPDTISSINTQYDTGIIRSNGSANTVNIKQKEGVFVFLHEALKAVVAVEAKHGWASGVLVSTNGHIVTNAHALPPVFDSISISRKVSRISVSVLVDGKWMAAEVVYVFAAPIDLAILKIIRNNNNNNNNRILLPAPAVLLGPSYTLKAGSSVAVAGYPLWRPCTSTRPLVTTGTAALTVPAGHGDAPAVILTTADVHAGASGGAVFDVETGCLIGVVTSNTRLGRPQQPSLRASPGQPSPSRDKKNQSVLLFPHLNYCLGSAVLDPVLQLLTAAQGSSLQLDWESVERTLKESGVIEAWHSMRSMENLDIPKEHIERKLPPALAALMKFKSGDGGGAAARPKL